MVNCISTSAFSPPLTLILTPALHHRTTRHENPPLVNSTMTSSPSRHSGLPSPPVVSSPRTAGRLRQMKSAHNLAANYNSGPSLISQQRHQQQQQLQQGSRIPSSAGIPALPSLPHRLPSPQKHDSPAKQGRTRANSDLAPSTHNTPAPSPTRKPAARKPVNAKDELDSLVRNGPKGELPLALANLRHWILCDGMDADSDGMVRNDADRISPQSTLISIFSSPTYASTSG